MVGGARTRLGLLLLLLMVGGALGFVPYHTQSSMATAARTPVQSPTHRLDAEGEEYRGKGFLRMMTPPAAGSTAAAGSGTKVCVHEMDG